MGRLRPRLRAEHHLQVHRDRRGQRRRRPGDVHPHGVLPHRGPAGFLAADPDGKGALLRPALYLDRTAPPAGAGQSAETPAHYRTHDVVVLYSRDHVKELYAGRLGLELLDANGVPVAGLDGRTLFEAAFTDPAHRALTSGETLFLEAIAGEDCSSVTSETVVPSDTQGFSLPVLAPGTLYRARILGGWSPDLGVDPSGEVTVGGSGPLAGSLELREVLRFEFVTSRYEGFAEHLGGYDPTVSLWDGEHAVRPPALDQAAAAALLTAVQDGTTGWDEAEKVVAAELLGRSAPPADAPEGSSSTVGALRGRACRDAGRVAGSRSTGRGSPSRRTTPPAVRLSSTCLSGPGTVAVRSCSGNPRLGAAALPRGRIAVELTYDLAVAPARYRGGASGIETGTLAVPLIEEAP